jgi:AcrR family transcriptional regulator
MMTRIAVLRYTVGYLVTPMVTSIGVGVKMAEARRPYRSALRQDQARSTRHAVVVAARDLFVEFGWSRTTIDAVAARAGVSRKTVFTSVGGKAALLKLAMDWALVGDDEPIAMSERQVIAELEQMTDPRALLARWALFIADLEQRAAPLAAVLAVAADADPDAADVHLASERNRLGGAEFIVARLTATGGLRAGLSTQRAVAAALVLMDPAVHRTLVHEHGWTLEEYARWIQRAATAELLEADPAGTDRQRTRSSER